MVPSSHFHCSICMNLSINQVNNEFCSNFSRTLIESDGFQGFTSWFSFSGSTSGWALVPSSNFILLIGRYTNKNLQKAIKFILKFFC